MCDSHEKKIVTDLHLDTNSRHRYLEKLSHSKTEANAYLSKKMNALK
jgi:hypothetical protein